MFDIAEIGEAPHTNEDAEWDAFVTAHPNGSLLQTTAWARLKSRFGWRSYRAWVRQEGKLVAGAQILFKSAAMRMIRIGYIPHGPLVDWQDDEQVTVMFNQIDWALYEHRAGMVKIEPLLWQHDITDAEWADICAKHNLQTETDTIQPPRTMLIDISAEPDAILKSMKSKTRYNIRLAARKGVTVREGSVADLPIFNELMKTTGLRNGFGVHAPEYYQAAYELFSADNNVALLIAEFEEKPLAASMIFKCGKKADYIAGGSNNEERNRMPTYAVQWAAIEWAKKQGCTVYDMWGLPDADAETLEAEFKERNDGLWGVYRFKRGFNGQVARTVGSADRVRNNLVYKLYKRRRGLS